MVISSSYIECNSIELLFLISLAGLDNCFLEIYIPIYSLLGYSSFSCTPHFVWHF